MALLRNAAARVGIGERRFDLGSPRLSLQLPDGSRLFALMAVAARPCLSVRRHRYMKVTCDDLVAMGTMDTALRELARALMRAKKSVVICGGTGVGKTTLLRAMAADIPPWERLVTIEDSFELGLDRYPDLHPDVVALESREPNLEGEGGVSLAELVRWALRLSPDRVIVGEARGEEVLALLNAMSQGSDGSMATLHASSSKGAFSKIATYAVQAPERLSLEATNLLVANAVHFVVFLSADRRGRRVVSSVREVVDAEGAMVVSNEVFCPGTDGRAVPGVPLRSETLDQLEEVGFDPGLLERAEGWWAPECPSRAAGCRDRAGAGPGRGRPAGHRAHPTVGAVDPGPATPPNPPPGPVGGGGRTGRGGHRLAGRGTAGRCRRLGGAGGPGRARAQAAGTAKVEAIAGWAEMLRDTMAGAAGLEQAIIASAAVAPLPVRRSVATLAARLEHDRLAPALRVVRRGPGRPERRPGGGGVIAGRRAPGRPPGRGAGHVGRLGPRRRHHAPAGGGGPGRARAPRSR